MAHGTISSRHRFLVETVAPGRVALPEGEAHHALHVLRLDTGAAVEIFDGRGTAATGGLVKLGKKEAAVETDRLWTDEPPLVRLTIASAVPKGERAEWLIEQCSQLGAWGVQWVGCARGVVRPREHGGKMDKWRRLAAESAKQCGRNFIMGIEPLSDVQDVVAAAVGRGEKVLWLEPREGESVRAALEQTAGAVTALVGPEGGWSAEEMGMLTAAAERGELTRVRLTETVLRIETACAAVAAVVMAGG